MFWLAAGLGVAIVAMAGLHVLTQMLMNAASVDQIVRTDQPTYRMRYRLLNLDREMSLGMWFSTLLIAANGLLMGVIAWVRRRQGRADVWPWILLALVFLGLSLDEAVAIHENLGPRVRGVLGSHATGLLYYAWYVPALAVAGVVGVCLIPFWRRLPGPTRWGLAAALAVYVIGAAGFEALMGQAMQAAGREDPPLRNPDAWLVLLVVAEEALEMIGMAVLTCVLWAYLSPSLQLRIVAPQADASR